MSGSVALKAARQVARGDAIVVQGPPPPFVSRAGAKLDAALDRFGVEVAGRRALDAGASTGGFSDCLLQRGVGSIVAVDVGYGQLHERVAGDPRVRVLDRTNVRRLARSQVGGAVDLVTADLSFISLELVLDALLGVLDPGGELVCLVKPQFEAGREEVARGRGIVVDPEVWRRVLTSVLSASQERGATIMGVMASPITGTDGNVEFLVHLCLGPSDRRPIDLASSVEGAVDEATAVRGTATGGPARPGRG